MAELALVNQVDQLTHQVNDVTTDQLMTLTTPFCILQTKGIPRVICTLMAVVVLAAEAMPTTAH